MGYVSGYRKAISSFHPPSCLLSPIRPSARWSSRTSLPWISEGFVTKFSPPKDLKLIARDKLTFDEVAVLHRVIRVAP